LTPCDNESGLDGTRQGGGWIFARCSKPPLAGLTATIGRKQRESSESGIIPGMHLDPANPLLPIATIAAGLFLMIAPRVLTFAVAVFLMAVGILGLNGIYHVIK